MVWKGHDIVYFTYRGDFDDVHLSVNFILNKCGSCSMNGMLKKRSKKRARSRSTGSFSHAEKLLQNHRSGTRLKPPQQIRGAVVATSTRLRYSSRLALH